MREEITWHQLVEWQQYYAIDPFGNERADLRSAMSGATIANEIRAIAAGLAGKRLDVIQVRDLMIDTSASVDTARKADRKGGAKSFRPTDNDRASAENYYKAWARSLDSKLKQADNPKPQRVSNPKRPTARKP